MNCDTERREWKKTKWGQQCRDSSSKTAEGSITRPGLGAGDNEGCKDLKKEREREKLLATLLGEFQRIAKM